MLEVVLGWRIALVILSTWPALCAARATTWPQICLAVGLPSYLSVSLPLSLSLTFVKRSSIEFNRRLFCALPFQKMITRWAHSMSCWAVRIVVRSASCPSSWHNCVRNWPCLYSPVSAGILFLYILNIYILYISYIYLSLSLSVEITHRFQSAREDVRALLLQCLLPWLQNMELVATSVPPATPLSYIMVSLGSRRRLMKGVKRGFSWCLSYCFFITLQAKCFASSKVRKAETV